MPDPRDRPARNVPDGLLEVGRLGRAHGVRGAIVVKLTTDRRERIAAGARLHDGEQWLTVASSRPVAGGGHVVQFAELADRTAAEGRSGRVLWAEPLADPEALWVHQLIGARVVDADGVDRGRCTAVLDNPAHDLLELDTGALVPVPFVDRFADGVIHVVTPAGLFDLDER